MGRKKTEDVWPRTVTYGNGRVRVSVRGNGAFALAWRKGGTWVGSTVRGTPEKALGRAAEIARNIDAAAGRQWISAAEAETMALLRRVAGDSTPAAAVALLSDAEAARALLAGRASMTEAARWWVERGPGVVVSATVAEAIARFLAEYDHSPLATQRTFRTELKSFLRSCQPEMRLAELDLAALDAWTGRKTVDGKKPSPRTVRSRQTTWQNLLNRCRDWGMLPEHTRHAAERMRRPSNPEYARSIFSVEQGKMLLAAVREKRPDLLAYVITGGWLGLRPSECQRLTWESFDWDRGYLHVSPKIAQKTGRERFVPVPPVTAAALQACRALGNVRLRGGKVAPHRAREYVSVLAREAGVVETWPSDVLRHSFCSYRLAMCQDVGRVAEEAGNSPGIIRRNYRRPVLPEDGAAWFALLA